MAINKSILFQPVGSVGYCHTATLLPGVPQYRKGQSICSAALVSVIFYF